MSRVYTLETQIVMELNGILITLISTNECILFRFMYLNVLGVSLVNPNIVFGNGFLAVGTDLHYDPTARIHRVSNPTVILAY